MLVKTRLQTVEITFKDSPLKFLSIEQYPPINEDLRDQMVRWDQPVRIIDDEGDAYTWWPDGRCVVDMTVGTKKVFWPLPTLKEAVNYGNGRENEIGGFFQFHRDGSVTCAAWGANYYWSWPRWADEIEGEWLEAEWDTETNDWVFNAYRIDDGYESADSYMTYDSTGHLYSYRRGRRISDEDLI